MPFSMICNNAKCGKQMEPYIDKKDDKVYCSLCDKEITNATHFVKMQMKGMKQYRQKTATSFGIKCASCSKEERPLIIKDLVCCPSCKKEHSHLSEAFKLMLKEKLKTVGKDVA